MVFPSSFFCRMIAFDLDGTLLQRHSVLSEKARAMLEQAAGLGILPVPATGRMLTFLPPCLTELPFLRYAITSNGAGVYDLLSGRCLYNNPIPPDRAAELVRFFIARDLWVECYIQGQAWIDAATFEKGPAYYGIPESKRLFVTKSYRIEKDLPAFLKKEKKAVEKINLPFLPFSQRTELWERMRAAGDITPVSSVDDNMEINRLGCHKGDGLRHLCEVLSIPLSQVFSMGDNGNDIELLQIAGLSAAMKNGTPEAKRTAHLVTDFSCEEDGAADCLQQLLQQQMTHRGSHNLP